MVTKNELKYYGSLLKKQARREEGKFPAEGKKLVYEGLMSSYTCEVLFATREFLAGNTDLPLRASGHRIEEISERDLQKLCETETPQGIVGIFCVPEPRQPSAFNGELIVALENVSDPGNAGTIIRTCDWFGIKEIVLSGNTVEIYNPKVLRSSMGSVFRIHAEESTDFLQSMHYFQENNYQLICADMEGENLYRYKNSEKQVLIFSNEASGPSAGILAITDRRITIPRFGEAESLNVASAAAIILSELKGRKAFS